MRHRVADHLACVVGDRDERAGMGKPLLDIRDRARFGLEGRDAIGDPLIVDLRDGQGVLGPSGAGGERHGA
jgi:hypothetical protein